MHWKHQLPLFTIKYKSHMKIWCENIYLIFKYQYSVLFWSPIDVDQKRWTFIQIALAPTFNNVHQWSQMASINPYVITGLSHFDHLDKSMLIIFHFYFIFDEITKQTVQPKMRHHIPRRLIWGCTVCLCTWVNWYVLKTKFLIYVKLVLISDTYCILICCYTPIANTHKKGTNWPWLLLGPSWLATLPEAWEMTKGSHVTMRTAS